MIKIYFLALILLSLNACTTLNFVADRVISPEQTGNTVIFRFKSSTARTVTVAGDFNGWEYRPDQKRAVKMERVGRTDLWEGKVEGLQPGRYQYKFVIDYQMWILDPNNPYTIDDGTGNRNSLLIVK
ncbi:MAG: glycogen-binding domain-containing protein [Endomicrobia bacterium]|nr:glycogen-binding domain-containing protein [Endomicrobiia bacterium]MCX7716771.1 glycogen-binding domain-containing protein [Endomicrobiia bacterium]